MKLGKKISGSKRKEVIFEPNRILGPTWSIEKVGDRYIYEYMSGGLAGGLKRHEITKADFEDVRAGRMSDYDLLLKYHLS
ncbi:hypothetical protein [Paracoccus alkanivorans]|uniref:Uncharacterized protein n=1 Tax=Paracoccus alkanivorans TaxID=2116655 RepID=A0A3M0MJQ5_9RHOB|nr:hypothetical protein [Paracoccus alkanivorans]RMC37831.1 hypothetical protein C9E81_03610 [Paracoccus alkanivorans]